MLFSINSYSQIKKTSINEAVGYKKAVVTAYCLKGSRMANGKFPTENSVAADLRYYKLGSRINLNGKSYIVSDTGSAIKGKYRFDIYIHSCRSAKKFGVKTLFLLI